MYCALHQTLPTTSSRAQELRIFDEVSPWKSFEDQKCERGFSDSASKIQKSLQSFNPTRIEIDSKLTGKLPVFWSVFPMAHSALPTFLMARERPLRDRTGSRVRRARKRGPALQGLEENEPEEAWLGECFEDQRWAKWVKFQGRSNVYIYI